MTFITRSTIGLLHVSKSVDKEVVGESLTDRRQKIQMFCNKVRTSES